MSTKEYTAALRAARAELEKLLKERANIDQRIAHLKNGIEVWETLSDSTDHSAGLRVSIGMTTPIAPGLSSNVRAALAESKLPLTAIQVRDRLAQAGLNLSVYASEMTVIHNTLNRLEKQGEVATVDAVGDKTLWTLTAKGREAMQKAEQVRKRIYGR
ncbi:MAG: hypothetical protein ACHP7P_12560 [Terriglobales bacterium]